MSSEPRETPKNIITLGADNKINNSETGIAKRVTVLNKEKEREFTVDACMCAGELGAYTLILSISNLPKHKTTRNVILHRSWICVKTLTKYHWSADDIKKWSFRWKHCNDVAAKHIMEEILQYGKIVESQEDSNES